MGFSYKNPPEVHTWRFRSEKIRSKTTMAVIADLHECVYGNGNCRLFAAIRRMSPDAVIIAGDLIVAASNSDCRETMSFLKRLADRYPVFYGAGNHERRALEKDELTREKKGFEKGLKEAGVSLMLNTSALLPGTGIRITGLDLSRIYYRRFRRQPMRPDLLRDLLGEADRSFYNVLIAHNPEYFPEYCFWKPDLILSGHVHGGIVRLPLIGGVISPGFRLFPKYDAGLFRKEGTRMLVSRGTGSHTIDLRFNNRPELLRVVLEPADRQR